MNLAIIKPGQQHVYFTSSAKFPTWSAACHAVHDGAEKNRYIQRALIGLYEAGMITFAQRVRPDGFVDYIAVGK